MIIGLKHVRVSSGNLVPSPSTENHLLSLSELADRKQALVAIFRKCPLANVQDCSVSMKFKQLIYVTDFFLYTCGCNFTDTHNFALQHHRESFALRI